MKCCFIILLFISGALNAQTIHWTGQEKKQDIGKELSIYEDLSRSFDIEKVSSSAFADSFKLSSTHTLDFEHSNSIFWIRFTVINDSKALLLLELAQTLVPEAALYYRDKTGRWQALRGGYNRMITKKPVQHHFQLFPLADYDTEYYLSVQANGAPIPIAVWNRDDYSLKTKNEKIVFGIYMGIMIFVILNNLFLFANMRRPAYLHYSLLVFFYAFFSALFEGYILYLFPKIDFIFWYILNPILNQPIGMLYAILFLDIKKYVPRLYKPALFIFFYFVCYIVWYRFLPIQIVHTITQVHALVGMFFMSALGILAGRNGNRLGYYFALAYFLFFVIAAIEVVYLQTGRPAHIFDISYVSIAIFIEVFFLLFLLSKRFQWEKDEMQRAKTDAQRKLLEQTMENARIVREQNVILEQKVNERTVQLQQANKDLNTSLSIIEKEKEKSDTLLLNILPAEVAEELKEKGTAEARLYENVTVLFSDFVNFTIISEQLGPRELVNKIHFFFKKFDEIIEKNGLEKIKTIGDAYLAVSGLPSPDGQHAKRAANAALEINTFIREEGGDFKIRIGLHSGPVVAGIVGVKKFAYDIWGDTVNIAARMEQHSETGRINLSGETYALINDYFNCTYRGKIKPKNKGEIDMYFLESRKQHT